MANYRGTLEIVGEQVSGPSADDPEAPIAVQLRFFAITNPGGKRIEVELRAGRGGNVFVQPQDEPVEVVEHELPSNATMRPVPPAARVTPFRVDDFRAPEQERDYVLFHDEVETNLRHYLHLGCAGNGGASAPWAEPLDDVPEPEMVECVACGKLMRAIPQDAAADDEDDDLALLDPTAPHADGLPDGPPQAALAEDVAAAEAGSE